MIIDKNIQKAEYDIIDQDSTSYSLTIQQINYKKELLVSMDNQWKQMIIFQPQFPKLSKSGIKNQFKKYKQILQNQTQDSPQLNYQQLLSSFTYKSIDLQSNQKQNSGINISRTSTNQSEACELSFSTSGDSFISPMTTNTVNTNIQTQCQQNTGKPAYIRQFNRLNSITPNYCHPDFQIKVQMKNLITLIKQCRQSINFVFNCAFKIGNRFRKLKVFSKSVSKNLTLDFFTNSGWENVRLDSTIQMLKPQKSFRVTHTFQIVLNELDLLLAKTSRYELATSLTQQIGLDLYKNIRQNLSEIEQKLIECSNSIYYLSLQNEYPEFYYKYLQILRTGLRKFTQKQIKYTIQHFRKLWDVEQPITSSEIGKKVWQILHRVEERYIKKNQ